MVCAHSLETRRLVPRLSGVIHRLRISFRELLSNKHLSLVVHHSALFTGAKAEMVVKTREPAVAKGRS